MLLKSLIFTILIMMFSGSVFSQEKAVSLDLDGAPGVWTPLKISQQIKSDLEELKIRKAQIHTLKLTLNIRSERLKVYQDKVELEERIAQQAILQAKKSDNQVKQIKKKYNTWYRHPLFLVGVGVLSTIAIQVVAIKTLEASR